MLSPEGFSKPVGIEFFRGRFQMPDPPRVPGSSPSQMENEDSRRKSSCFWKNVKTPGASCHVSGKKCVLVAPVVVFSEKSNDSRRESPYFRELMPTHAASLHVF